MSALYLAMLGYPADAEGMAHWQAALSVQDVIDGLAATDRYRERSRALLGNEGAGGSADLVQAAWRLDRGAGMIELSDLPPTVAAHAAFEVLPWAEVCAGIPSPRVRVLGRYARELSAELAAREPAASVQAGLGSEVPDQPDILILTRGGDFWGLGWARPDLIRNVRHRLILPIQTEPRRPEDETTAVRARLRLELHRLGFTQVRHMFCRGHGGGVVWVDTTLVTPEPDAVHRMANDPVVAGLVPPSTWFIADRVATEEAR